MREIKFRAWLGDRSWMELWNSEFFSDMSPVTSYGSEFPDDDDIILMQYTGLKDKNGVEIYEGDIIKRLRGSESVVFHNGAFCISWKNSHPTVLSHSLDDYDGIVIGNIHQNPELLEVK